MATVEQARAMREETGMGLHECKRILARRERLEKLQGLQRRIWVHSQHDPIAAVIDDLIALLIDDDEE